MSEKLKLDDIKNIDVDTKNIIEQDISQIKKMKYKIKSQTEKAQTNYITLFEKKVDNPHPDIMAKLLYTNTFYRAKADFLKLCNINLYKKLDTTETYNQITSSKDESDYPNQNMCISLYGQNNLKNMETVLQKKNNLFDSEKSGNKTVKKTRSIFYKFHRVFHLYKDNFLKLRRNMSDINQGEYTNFIKEISENKIKGKNRNLTLKNSLVKAMLNPKVNGSCCKYYLPRSGSLLLTKNF